MRAISGTSGSSGLGSHSSEQMERRTEERERGRGRSQHSIFLWQKYNWTLWLCMTVMFVCWHVCCMPTSMHEWHVCIYSSTQRNICTHSIQQHIQQKFPSWTHLCLADISWNYPYATKQLLVSTSEYFAFLWIGFRLANVFCPLK